MNQNEIQNLGQKTVNIAESFLQQSVGLLETQTAAVRALMRNQARSFAALGGPDWSSMYTPENERQFSEFVKTSTEQALSLMRQTNESLRQFQEVFSQLVGQQTSQLTAQIRTGTEEIAQRTQQAQQRVLEASQQTPQQAREASQQVAQQIRNASEQAWQGSAVDERERSDRPA